MLYEMSVDVGADRTDLLVQVYADFSGGSACRPRSDQAGGNQGQELSSLHVMKAFTLVSLRSAELSTK
jgi:hypothetical protein